MVEPGRPVRSLCGLVYNAGFQYLSFLNGQRSVVFRLSFCMSIIYTQSIGVHMVSGQSEHVQNFNSGQLPRLIPVQALGKYNLHRLLVRSHLLLVSRQISRSESSSPDYQLT